MSYDLNSFNAIGRLVKSPEISSTTSGKNVSKFTLAIGTGKDKACFIDCQAWEKLSETVQNYCEKGKQIACQGSIEQQTWDDKASGQKRSKIIFNVRSIQLLGSKTDSSAREGTPERSTVNRGESSQVMDFEPLGDEDVPF